jgi:hypothetical protein
MNRRIAIYALIVLLAVGGFLGYWLWDSKRRNEETGNQLNKIAEQMEKQAREAAGR